MSVRGRCSRRVVGRHVRVYSNRKGVHPGFLGVHVGSHTSYTGIGTGYCTGFLAYYSFRIDNYTKDHIGYDS